jgi:oligoribonuclease NrnB/cAMP/cGMP phosphodiesterase (DHH superfamily)
MIDFCYKKDVLREFQKKNKRVIVLDHHKSAKEDIEEAGEYVFDVEHSGSVIAWKYFFGEKIKMPTLLKYIEDTDLWRLKLSKSKEIFAFISTLKFDFLVWDKEIKKFEDKEYRKKIIEKGKSIISYEESVINRLLPRASLVEFEGYKVLALNSPFLVSELGNRLANLKPPFAIVWAENKGRINVSLRSTKNFDVSLIALKYGGGGHPNAAGFSFDASLEFPWKIIK